MGGDARQGTSDSHAEGKLALVGEYDFVSNSLNMCIDSYTHAHTHKYVCLSILPVDGSVPVCGYHGSVPSFAVAGNVPQANTKLDVESSRKRLEKLGTSYDCIFVLVFICTVALTDQRFPSPQALSVSVGQENGIMLPHKIESHEVHDSPVIQTSGLDHASRLKTKTSSLLT